jgi:hypothetical protein
MAVRRRPYGLAKLAAALVAAGVLVGAGAVSAHADQRYVSHTTCGGVRSVSAYVWQQGNGYHYYNANGLTINTSAGYTAWTYRQTVGSSQSTSAVVVAAKIDPYKPYGATCY